MVLDLFIIISSSSFSSSILSTSKSSPLLLYSQISIDKSFDNSSFGIIFIIYSINFKNWQSSTFFLILFRNDFTSIFPWTNCLYKPLTIFTLFSSPSNNICKLFVNSLFILFQHVILLVEEEDDIDAFFIDSGTVEDNLGGIYFGSSIILHIISFSFGNTLDTDGLTVIEFDLYFDDLLFSLFENFGFDNGDDSVVDSVVVIVVIDGVGVDEWWWWVYSGFGDLGDDFGVVLIFILLGSLLSENKL